MNTSNQTYTHLKQCNDRLSETEKESLPVWPIRTEEDYQQASEIVTKLAVKGEDNLTDAERDQLDIFDTLLEAYAAVHYQINLPKLSPIELLKSLMETSGMNESDLGRLLGDRPLGHRILKGERELSKKHIRILSDYFKIDPGYFFS